MRTARLGVTLMVATVLVASCSIHTGGNQAAGGGNGGASDLDAYGAGYQGDGVQCGAIVCSGSQQCCLVYVAADANSSGPTHACDQDCQSICADVCPDAGGMIQSFPPSATAMPTGMAMGGPAPSTEGGMPMGAAMPVPPQGGAMGQGGPTGPGLDPAGGPQDAGADS